MLEVSFNRQGIIYNEFIWKSMILVRPHTETHFTICERLSAVNALIFGNLETGYFTPILH